MLRVVIVDKTEKIFNADQVKTHYIEVPVQTPDEFIQDIKDATPGVNWKHGPMGIIETDKVQVQVEIYTPKTSSHYAVGKAIVDLVTKHHNG